MVVLRQRFLPIYIFTFCLYFVQTSQEKCDACGNIVYGIKHGLKRTEKSHFGGGNTAWEEEKIGKYSRSETRLVEAMERVCKTGPDNKDLDREKSNECHSMVEEFEETIENWYFHKQQSNSDLHKWLCIDQLNVCCPENHWGPECAPCLGPDLSRPCFGNGRCDGNGTRRGTGKCKCDEGYQGNLCRKCTTNYFMSNQNDTDVSCLPCHVSCKGGCTAEGPIHCSACKSGWEFNAEEGCEDIDECLSSPCSDEDNRECVNSVGSFKCNCKSDYKEENSKCVLNLTESAKNETENAADADSNEDEDDELSGSNEDEDDELSGNNDEPEIEEEKDEL